MCSAILESTWDFFALNRNQFPSNKAQYGRQVSSIGESLIYLTVKHEYWLKQVQSYGWQDVKKRQAQVEGKGFLIYEEMRKYLVIFEEGR